MYQHETSAGAANQTAGFRFDQELVPSWPDLSWLAICEHGSKLVRVLRGPNVESGPGWFCEAVWDSDFASADFDRTDLVFGSGGRIRGSGAAFVSAGSTVDRLQFIVCGGRTLISNSLACLLEGANAGLDPAFRGYDEHFEQIIRGIDEGAPDLPLGEGTVGFAYFRNLLWDGKQLRPLAKPEPKRDFSTFDNYMGFLRGALQRIADNMTNPLRRQPLEWVGTISSGYDSATCAALAREVGMRQVITFNESRPGTRDDGLDVADVLGLDCALVDRLAWKQLDSPEPPFLAADAQGKEVMFAGVPLSMRGKVLVTGENGGMSWGKEFTPRDLPFAPVKGSPDSAAFPRRFHSGLSLTEFRLHAGFIHLPIPFIGARQFPDLQALSNSAAMAPWDIEGYSRPICRRVLEVAGVPRAMFGMTKTGASIRFLRGEDAWSPGGKRSVLRWIQAERTNFGLSRATMVELRLLLRALEAALSLASRTPPRVSWRLRLVAGHLSRRMKARGFNDLAFHWSIAIVRKHYRRQ